MLSGGVGAARYPQQVGDALVLVKPPPAVGVLALTMVGFSWYPPGERKVVVVTPGGPNTPVPGCGDHVGSFGTIARSGLAAIDGRPTRIWAGLHLNPALFTNGLEAGRREAVSVLDSMC